MRSLFGRIKTKVGLMYVIIFLTLVVLRLSYSAFRIMSDNYKSSELLISNLMYGIEINSLGGEETINGNVVTLPAGKITAIIVKINSLNSINSNYGVDYKITSGEGKVYYGSTTVDKVSDSIENYNSTTTKLVKVFIEATTDIIVEFNISGGYSFNTKVDERKGYKRIEDMYTDSFKVTLDVQNGTSDVTEKTTTFNGSLSFTITPNDGYVLENASISCSNGTLSNNLLTISNVQSDVTCTITLDEDGITLAKAMLRDNPTISERTNFSSTNEATTTGTIYKTNKTEDGSDVYYYSGNTTNNWVKFGGFFWRIIRTNEDGSVRMLYSGTSHGTTSGFISSSTGFMSGSIKYNDSTNPSMYVGYMYGTSDSLENNRTNENDSTIKKTIDSWYENNLLTNYDKYISKSAIYCNDRSVGSGTYNSSYSGNSSFYFGSYTRLYSNRAPSYKCGANISNGLFENTQAIADKFSASTLGGGNGQLKYPIALMTADEVAFAGGVYNTKLSSPYAWYYTNSTGNSIIAGSGWWTMSPGSYASVAGVWAVYTSSDAGSLNVRNVGAMNGLNVRPVISISKCAKVTGTGTSTDPYEIDESSCS